MKKDESQAERLSIPGLLNSVKHFTGLTRLKVGEQANVEIMKTSKDQAVTRKKSTLPLKKNLDSEKKPKEKVVLENQALVKSVTKKGVSSQEKMNSDSQGNLPVELVRRLELYPENKRRPVNKTVFSNAYFQLTYNVKNDSLSASSKGDIIYSAIPYDTARNYIQRAAIQTLLYPEETRHYIEAHKSNLETYLSLAIYQLTGKKVIKDSLLVQNAYRQIFQDPLFEMQVLGRLLQHDETGPISANIAGKFLYSENLKTGISSYLSEYIKFVLQFIYELPLTTDGTTILLLTSNTPKEKLIARNDRKLIDSTSDISKSLEQLPETLKVSLEQAMAENEGTNELKPLLRSESGQELSALRKNYQAHSKNPEELKHYFENVIPTENENLVNVVSDMHVTTGKLPFINHHFNILVGDISDSEVTDAKIKGIYVLGNHELVDVLKNDFMDVKWDSFREKHWFKEWIKSPDESWPLLPVGDNPFYEVVKEELQERFPKLAILNNECFVHEGVRYLGITVPVALVERKKEIQNFIYDSLKELLATDTSIPTVIVSHAPLFNELSRLSPRSKAYNPNYDCSDGRIKKLFEFYNIIGAIHGHHHIPASFGRFKTVSFVGKELFVVCSIYSPLNTGFELTSLLKGNLDKNR